MLGIARFAMRGQVTAASVASALLLFGLFAAVLLGAAGAVLSFLAMIASCAIVTLTFLRQGERAGLQVTAAGIIMLTVASLMMGGGALQALLLVVTFWLPATVGAVVLRRYIQLELALLVLAGLAIAGVLLVFVFMGDPTAFWEARLGQWSEDMVNAGAFKNPDGTDLVAGEKLSEFVSVLARSLTGTMAVSLFWLASLSLLLARFWQARLYNPGGFQLEFHALEFGKPAAAVALGVTLLSMLMARSNMLESNALLLAVTMVLVAVFMFQGLAVIHSLVKSRSMSQGWLVGIYVLMMFIHTMALLAALGLADNWLNIRQKGKQ